MKEAILLIDGENFLHKVKDVLIDEKVNDELVDILDIRLNDLAGNIFAQFKDIKIKEIRYYAAKLHMYMPQKEKSTKLISAQRKLKHNLEKQNIKFITSGHVRAQESSSTNGKKLVTFREKGVDVRIAVDMVTIACDRLADTIILCSSDSDLQPAVKESRRRKTEIIYLGFSLNPNKGLSATTSQTVLFRNLEIIEAVRKSKTK